MNPPDRYDATGNVEAEYEPGTAVPPLDYGFEEESRREAYIAAVKRGYLQDYSVLVAIAREAILRGMEG